jgi:hypothetical protein
LVHLNNPRDETAALRRTSGPSTETNCSAGHQANNINEVSHLTIPSDTFADAEQDGTIIAGR